MWDRNGGLPTLISTGVGDNYVHTAGISRDGDDWLLADAVGSVRATVDDTGATVGSQDFTVFGEQLAGTGSFGFTGEQQDLTGQLHLRARQYNPTLGRFTTVDPVQPGAPGTTGYNLYTYSGNNPTTWTDPSGRAVLADDATFRSNAARNAATLAAFNAGRQRALAELARQAATRQLMQQIRRQLLLETGTRVLETLVVSVGGGSEEGLTRRSVVDATGQLDDPLDTEAVPNPNTGSTSTATRTGECQDLGPGSVTYGPLLSAEWAGTQRGVDGPVKQFATGASAVLTPHFLAANATGTEPSPRPSPAGFDGLPYHRAHLIGAQLGGSNIDGANFVSLHQNKNSGRMRVIEDNIASVVNSCEVVTYAATPNFDFAVPQPLASIGLLAVSEQRGVIVNELIPNTNRAGQR